MKKITLTLFALLVTLSMWQVNAQTFNGATGPITDNDCPNLNAFPATSNLTGVIGTEYAIDNVALDITHTWDGDLQISLTGPDGTSLDLSLNNGGSANDYTGTVFQDGGADIEDASAPFTGTFEPVGGTFASKFDGLSVTGDWSLQICDGAGGDTGTLDSYAITFLDLSAPIGDPPVIACPGNISVDNDAGLCSAVVNFADAIAIDPEDGTIPTVQTMGPPSGSVFPKGDTVIEFSATDTDGNTATCQFTVTVNDAEAPIVMCQNFTVELDTVTGGVVIDFADIDNGSSDNCGNMFIDISPSVFGCADLGENTVTLTITDDAGNSASCESIVTIEDNTAPEITCIGQPGNISVFEDFEAAAIPTGWTTASTGNWDWSFGSGTMPGSGGNDFPTNAGIFDDDAAGNGEVNVGVLLSPVYDMTGVTSATLSFDYSFQEAGDQEYTVEVWDGSAWQQVLFVDEDTVPTNTGAIPVLPFANNAFQVRFTYDDLGNWGWSAGVDNFQLDYEIPATPLSVDLDASGNVTVNAADLLLNVDEACGYIVTVGGGAPAPETLTTTFAGGNGFSGNMFDVKALNDLSINSFDISLADATTDDIEVWFRTGSFVGFELSNAGWTLLTTATGITSAGDNVPTPLNLNLGQAVTAGDTVAFYVTTTLGGTINYTNGGTAGDLFASDANLEFYEGAGGGYFDVAFSPRVFNGNIQYSMGAAPSTTIDLDCSNLGENQIEVTVTDAAGNVSTCMSTVNVNDVTAPIITCGPLANVTSITEDFEAANVPAGWSTEIVGGSWDWTFGSGDMPTGGSFSSNAAIFDDDAEGGGGDNNVSRLISDVYDMTDASTGTLSFDYALQEFAGSGILNVEVYDGAAWQMVFTIDVDTDPTNSGPIPVLSFANAAFQVRFTYDDENAGWNWGAGVDNFQLDFETPPVSSNVIIELDENGMATIDPYVLISSVDEACGIATAAVDITEVTCADIGTPFEVNVFVSDASGNIASCVAMVEVVDLLGPELTCPGNQTQDPGAGNIYYEVPDYFALGEATATDNCTDPVVVTSQDPAAGTLVSDGVYTVTITAEDEYGNSSTCNFELTIESTLGSQDNPLNSAISIYPNPANNEFTLSNSSSLLLDSATIFDINGKLIMNINLQDMQSEKVINISDFATGVYMVHIVGEQSTAVKRLIKK